MAANEWISMRKCRVIIGDARDIYPMETHFAGANTFQSEYAKQATVV